MLRRILASEGCRTIPTQHPGWTEIERDSARDLTALIDAGGHVGTGGPERTETKGMICRSGVAAIDIA
jgi:hypothetical protein